MSGDLDAAAEMWLPIPGCGEFYSASSLGRIRSGPSPTPTAGRQRGRVLKTWLNRKGYPVCKICLPNQPDKTIAVHRLVAAAFLGEARHEQQVNHKNGEKTDNRPSNLEYVSCEENIRHCWANGLHGVAHCQGEANKRSRLTVDDVRAIRSAYPEVSLVQLAKSFGVTKQAIWHVVHRKTWTHI
jgi:hypothetical protein